MNHELKCWPEPFQAIVDGRKLFEIRKDDRGYAVGDVLLLREYDVMELARNLNGPIVTDGYSGRSLRAEVTYKVAGGSWGLPSDLCVLGIRVLT
jgi:hypothetical protein